jgi:hypothetical protein
VGFNLYYGGDSYRYGYYSGALITQQNPPKSLSFFTAPTGAATQAAT